MTRLLAPVLVVGALALCLAACGDTRSNQTLNGVATWPGGGPAHGPWQDYTYNYPPTYPPAYAPYDYGSSSVTTTTTTVQPGAR